MFLITRPLDDSLALADMLAERGHTSVVSPMLDIKRFAQPESVSADGVIITSRYAIPASPIGLPCYVVGESTALAMPYREQLQVFLNAQALIAGLPQHVAEGKRLLYLRGKEVTSNLPEALPQYDWQEHIAYRAEAMPRFSNDALAALRQHEITDILLFSRRSAQQFEALLSQEIAKPAKMNAWCLSKDIASALTHACWRKKHWPPEPQLASMLTLLPSAA